MHSRGESQHSHAYLTRTSRNTTHQTNIFLCPHTTIPTPFVKMHAALVMLIVLAYYCGLTTGSRIMPPIEEEEASLIDEGSRPPSSAVPNSNGLRSGSSSQGDQQPSVPESNIEPVTRHDDELSLGELHEKHQLSRNSPDWSNNPVPKLLFYDPELDPEDHPVRSRPPPPGGITSDSRASIANSGATKPPVAQDLTSSESFEDEDVLRLGMERLIEARDRQQQSLFRFRPIKTNRGWSSLDLTDPDLNARNERIQAWRQQVPPGIEALQSKPWTSKSGSADLDLPEFWTRLSLDPPEFAQLGKQVWDEQLLRKPAFQAAWDRHRQKQAKAGSRQRRWSWPAASNEWRVRDQTSNERAEAWRLRASHQQEKPAVTRPLSPRSSSTLPSMAELGLGVVAEDDESVPEELHSPTRDNNAGHEDQANEHDGLTPRQIGGGAALLAGGFTYVVLCDQQLIDVKRFCPETFYHRTAAAKTMTTTTTTTTRPRTV